MKVDSMFLAIITMSMILKKQTNLFSNDYNSFISLVSLVTKVISWSSLSIERHSYTGCCLSYWKWMFESHCWNASCFGWTQIFVCKIIWNWKLIIKLNLKIKATASCKLGLVKSGRKTCSHRMKFCVQRGFGELHSTSKWKGKLQSTVRCVLTPLWPTISFWYVCDICAVASRDTHVCLQQCGVWSYSNRTINGFQ